MNEPDCTSLETPSEKIGIFRSWRQLYLTVLVYTVVLILLLHLLGSYLLSEASSVPTFGFLISVKY